MRAIERLLLFVAILATSNPSQIAFGKTITVRSTADDGPGSLRQALAQASNSDKINIIADGVFTLTGGELNVNKSVTINGPGPHGIIKGKYLDKGRDVLLPGIP